MAENARKNSFDTSFGATIHDARRAAGFKSSNTLSGAVESKTGVELSPDTLRRIESGWQGCTVEQYAAILATMEADEAEYSRLIIKAASGARGPLGEYFRAKETAYRAHLLFVALEGHAAFVSEADAACGGLCDAVPGDLRYIAQAFRAGAFGTAENPAALAKLEGAAKLAHAAFDDEALAAFMQSPEWLRRMHGQTETAGNGETIAAGEN